MNFSDPIIDGYYDYCKSIKKMKHSSVKDLRCTMNKLQRYLYDQKNSNYIWELPLSEFVRYFNFLRENNERGTGISKQISQVRTFIDYCWRAEYCTKNPLVGFSIKDDSPQYVPRFLTLDEVERLILVTDRRTRRGRKERLIILFLYGLGLRTSELCDIRVKDISIEDQDLFIKGKFDIERRIPFPETVLVELLAYLHETNYRKGFLFRTEIKKVKYNVPGVGRIVKEYASLANIDGVVTPKSLRHTFASHLIEEGVDVSVISMLMGHKSPIETGAYLHAFEKSQKAAALEFDTLLED